MPQSPDRIHDSTGAVVPSPEWQDQAMLQLANAPALSTEHQRIILRIANLPGIKPSVRKNLSATVCDIGVTRRPIVTLIVT